MALTLLSDDALNTRLPSTPPENDITWHDPPSSPFIDMVDHENTQVVRTPTSAVKTTPPQSSRRSPQKPKSPSKTTQEFEILMDEDAIEATPRPAKQDSPTKQPASAIKHNAFWTAQPKLSPVKRTTSSEDVLRENEGLTIAMKIMEESQQDMTQLGDDIEIDNTIDDTCFSTFSEIPNTDMTAFARLGQRSPSKQFDLVGTSSLKGGE